MSLVEKTATDLLAGLTARQYSAVELAQAYLDRIKQQDGKVQAFLRVDEESALAQAKNVDQRRAAGKKLGPLAGLPVAVKDVLCSHGELTTCASKILENFRSPYDSTVVAKLKQADAVLLGRTNMDEFAMGGSTENSAYQKTRNPWNLDCIPGGSSGGSAACVAARMVPLSIGTDTGGSIRQPAGLCGITGLKPTYGRVSRFGLVAFASSLDQIGPMAQSAEDAALLLETIAGHDPRDSTSVNLPVPNYASDLKQPLSGLKLGVVKEHYGPGLDAEVDAAVSDAVRKYQSLGAQIVELSMPHGKYAVAVYYIIAPCEASSNLARYDGVHYGYRTNEARMRAELAEEEARIKSKGKLQDLDQLDTPLVKLYRKSRAEGFGAEVKRRIMLGTYALSAGYYDAYYLKALQVRRLIREDYDNAFQQVDLIIGPVTSTTAFKLGEKCDDPLAMYLVDLYTVSANLAGVAGISIPCGQSKSGLPIGLQLQAPPFAESSLLKAAHLFQQHTDWHKQAPALS